MTADLLTVAERVREAARTPPPLLPPRPIPASLRDCVCPLCRDARGEPGPFPWEPRP